MAILLVIFISPALMAYVGQLFAWAQPVLQAWLSQHVVLGLYLLPAIACAHVAGLYALLMRYPTASVRNSLRLAAHILPGVFTLLLLETSFPSLEATAREFALFGSSPTWLSFFSCVTALASGVGSLAVSFLVLFWLCCEQFALRYRRGTW